MKQSSSLAAGLVTRRDLLRLAAIGGATTLILSGCQTALLSPTSAAGDKPVEIRYATGGGTAPTEMQVAIFSEPMQQSVLQHYGKDYTLSLIKTKGTPEAQTLLVAGQADMGTLAFSTIATTVAKNAVPGGISIIAGQFVDGQPGSGTMGYLVLAESGITSAADLKGRTLGVNAVGSGLDMILRGYLRQHGLDPLTDVQIVEIGFGAMGAALREGRIDLGTFVQPFQAVEMDKGGVAPLFLTTDVVKPYAPIATVARSNFLQQHPEAVRAFLADWVRGLSWLMDAKNRDEAIKIMSDISKTPTETLALFYGKAGVDYYRDPRGCPNAEALQVGIDAMIEQGLLDQRVDVTPLVDTSYLPQPCE